MYSNGIWCSIRQFSNLDTSFTTYMFPPYIYSTEIYPVCRSPSRVVYLWSGCDADLLGRFPHLALCLLFRPHWHHEAADRVEVDPNVVMPSSKMTALHVICGSRAVADEVCDKRVIDIFLNCNADLNAMTEEGWTPLFKAVQAQKLETVKHLLGKCKKDDLSMVQHKDNNGDTPLHLAAKINAFSIVRELLEFAANADKVKKDAANQRDESPGGGQNDGQMSKMKRRTQRTGHS